MSIAKVVSVTKCRKDQGKCGKCGTEIKKGDGYVHWTVGYRGATKRRCSDPKCFPRTSERESSRVADVYAAQESAQDQLLGETTGWRLEELEEIRDDVVSAAEEVADEYESNEMYERNEDLQERAEMIRSYADKLSDWEPEAEEPHVETEETWTDIADSWEEAHESWLNEQIANLESAIMEGELP